MDKISTCQKGWKTAENASLANRETGLPTMKTLKSENNEAHADEKAGEEGGSETAEEAVSDKTGFFTPNEKIDFNGVKIEPLFSD